MNFPIFIRLRRSKILLAWLVFIHGLAALCMFAPPWPGFFRAASLIPIVFSAYYTLRRPAAFTGLCLATPDAIDFFLTENSRAPATLLPGCTVFIFLIVLRLRLGEETRTRSLTLLPDQMSAEEFRQLRLWLRWQKPASKQDASA